MATSYTTCKLSTSVKLHGAAFRGYTGCRKLSSMTTHRVYLKNWRRYRHLTQGQVVNRLAIHEDSLLPKTEASLSRLENGKQQYSQRVLEALADIYGCEPSELLSRDPFKDGHLIDFLRALDERKQQQVIAIIEALAKTDGTNG